MTQPTNFPSASPKQNNTWVIVLVVVLLLCCFCIGAVGLILAFGQPLLDELGLAAVLQFLPGLL